MKIKCSKCQYEGLPTTKVVGPHIGLYCPKCNTYIKWANKRERIILKDKALDNLNVLEDCIDAEKFDISPDEIINKLEDDEVPW